MAEARLRYLNEASRCLLSTSPAISAHLQTVRRSLVEEALNDVSSAAKTGSMCQACGFILMAGQASKPTSNSHSKRTRQDRLKQAESGVKITKLQCQQCGSISTIERSKLKAQKLKAAQQKLSPTPGVVQGTARKIDSTVKPAANSIPAPAESEERSPRKRPRNKKASLQSIIAGQKTSKQPAAADGGFGLDLMDLMKP